MGRKPRRCSLKFRDFQKKRIESTDGRGSGTQYDNGLEDEYDETDDYAEEHPSSETQGFGWINGVGILVGVAGMFFGVPLFF